MTVTRFLRILGVKLIICLRNMDNFKDFIQSQEDLPAERSYDEWLVSFLAWSDLWKEQD